MNAEKTKTANTFQYMKMIMVNLLNSTIYWLSSAAFINKQERRSGLPKPYVKPYNMPISGTVNGAE